MRNWTLLFLLLLLPAFSAGAGTDRNGAHELLRVADAMRNPSGDFSVQIDLTEYRSGRKIATSSLQVYAKPAPGSGQYNNLVRFLSPRRDNGKLLLRNGQDLWFYDPDSRSSIRISPQARLLGQASNGDVMSSNLAADYDAEFIGHESIEDGNGVVTDASKLRLTSNGTNVTYSAVDYWIDLESKRPIKAQFYSAEQRLLKTAYFRRYQDHLGASRPTETVIIDELDPSWITVMTSSNYQLVEIPQSWLQRDYLPRFDGHAN